MLVIFLVLFVLIVYWTAEYIRHQRNLQSIPIRIHVNGTRGKSSVTRLIAAGLRAGGLKTFAKTTGTLPRIIDDKGLEIPVPRPKMVNIIEQVGIVKYISRRNPQAMVIECMAVLPEYQWICEHKMIKSTVGVITNVRMDHVREMGPTFENIARSLCNTLPRRGVAFTSSRRSYSIMLQEAEKLGTEVRQISGDTISDQELGNFSYVEHRGNIALALAVCQHLGVDRDVALRGMYKTHPDVGAMKIFKIREGSKDIFLVNALAANDPESTLEVWRNLDKMYNNRDSLIILLNTRADRFDRTIQLLEMVRDQIDFQRMVLIGEKVEQVLANALRLKFNRSRIIPLGMKKPEDVYKHIVEQSVDDGLTLVLAMGNMGGGGLQVAHYFKKKSDEVVQTDVSE